MTKLPDSDPKRNIRETPHGGAPGSAVGEHSLGAAIGELHAQHPKKYNDLGPHHGGDSHMRHMPLHGLKSKG
jgi:hypothetical protein